MKAEWIKSQTSEMTRTSTAKSRNTQRPPPGQKKVLCLGTLIIDTLEKLNHSCPSAMPTILNSLWILTAGRTPRKKLEQDWKLTNQTAHILLMNLRRMHIEDLIELGDNALESLKIFVQSHLPFPGKPMDEEKGPHSLERCPRITNHESLRHYHRTPQNPK